MNPEGPAGLALGIVLAMGLAVPSHGQERPTGPAQKRISAPAISSVASQFSQRTLTEGKYFETIVAQVEGFSSTAYRDNKGVAVAFGWNASYQTRRMNRLAGIQAVKSKVAASTLEGLSGQFDVETLPKLHITPEQGIAMTNLLYPAYEAHMRKWIPGFEKLAPHQQAVVVYHVYKTGPAGAVKYRKLKRRLIEMIADPTSDATRSAAAEFQYTYEIDGVRYKDLRSTLYMQALFRDPRSYAALIGVSSPLYAASTVDQRKDNLEVIIGWCEYLQTTAA